MFVFSPIFRLSVVQIYRNQSRSRSSRHAFTDFSYLRNNRKKAPAAIHFKVATDAVNGLCGKTILFFRILFSRFFVEIVQNTKYIHYR